MFRGDPDVSIRAGEDILAGLCNSAPHFGSICRFDQCFNLGSDLSKRWSDLFHNRFCFPEDLIVRPVDNLYFPGISTLTGKIIHG